MHVVVCLIIIGAHMNILFMIKVKILVLIQWSYTSPKIMFLLSLERLAYFEHVLLSNTYTAQV